MKRILWGITGSGDKISEIIDIMIQVQDMANFKLYVIVSKAGEQMLRRYGLWDTIQSTFNKVKREVNANVPFVAGPLQTGHYDLFVVAPLTANSTAKIAHGIADTLVTNAVAQTLKGNTPVVLYPVDQVKGTIETVAPNGISYRIHPRAIDLENVERLHKMQGVEVVPEIHDIAKRVKLLTE